LTKEQLKSAALSGEIEDLLEWFDAKSGDTFFIPAGTVHAIGAGIVLCEIQQHSDVTYRLYDYGRPRELHLDHAVMVSDRGPCRHRPATEGNLLVACDYFETSLIQPGKHAASNSERLLIAIHGTGQIEGEPLVAGEVIHLDRGRSFDVGGNVTLLIVQSK
jgi:mannose-6-phosphate isomerase